MIFGVEVEHGRTTALRAQAVPHQFKPDLLRPGLPSECPVASFISNEISCGNELSREISSDKAAKAAQRKRQPFQILSRPKLEIR